MHGISYTDACYNYYLALQHSKETNWCLNDKRERERGDGDCVEGLLVSEPTSWERGGNNKQVNKTNKYYNASEMHIHWK